MLKYLALMFAFAGCDMSGQTESVVNQEPISRPVSKAKGKGKNKALQAENSQLTKSIDSSAGSSNAPVLFGLGVHIEPFGAVPSNYVSAPKTKSMTKYRDYTFQKDFNLHEKTIQDLAYIAESHKGRLTIQAQSPFTVSSVEFGSTVLPDLEARGHEIALHFHQDAHLGKNADNEAVDTWVAVLKEEIELIHKTGVKGKIRFMSGGNQYPHLLEAASKAGIDILGDYKNQDTQLSDEKLVDLTPWRPMGSPTSTDVSRFSQHDSNGKIIFLPEGLFSKLDFGANSKSDNPSEFFDFLTESLEFSLREAESGKVNVFRLTIHPGEFNKGSSKPYEIVDQWMTRVLDPAIAANKVRFVTFSQMADSYTTWERSNPGKNPRK